MKGLKYGILHKDVLLLLYLMVGFKKTLKNSYFLIIYEQDH